MGARCPREVVLDMAALVGVERGDEKMLALLEVSLNTSIRFLVPAASSPKRGATARDRRASLAR
jgi:hypothetical protein